MLGMNPYRLRSRTGWKTLPLELQLKVHRLLPVRDLKSAVLVNKDWNRVGEDPSLWRWVVVRVRSREDIAKLSVKRLVQLQEIQIALHANLGIADWELFFQNVEKLAQVKAICGLGNRDLKGVDSGLLARVLTGLEHVILWRTQLTVQQLTSIFHDIAVRDTKIKKLSIWRPDLSGVPSNDLCVAVSKLECVDFNTKLTTAQLTSIMLHIVENETKIKILNLRFNNLSTVDGYLLNRAKNKLSEWGGIIYH